MSSKNSDQTTKEYVILRGKKYFVHNKELNLSGITNFKISEIKGLDELTDLEALYLKGNSIKKIEGLDNLTSLKYLNL